MSKKYATIKKLVPGTHFDFFNNFNDQVFKDKTICIDEVGYDWYDCLNDDEQDYVQQMPKYSHLDYDDVIKQYDQDSLANIIKKEESNGWKCDHQGNVIGFIKQMEVA
jgi:hypothetical protein